MRSDMPKWMQTMFMLLLAAIILHEVTGFIASRFRGCTGDNTKYYLFSGECYIVTHQPTIYTRKELP